MFLKKNLIIFCLGVLFFSSWTNNLNAEVVTRVSDESVSEKVDVYLLEREGCAFCAKELAFLEDLSQSRDDFNLIVVDVAQKDNKQRFDLLAEKYGLLKATPTTIIGENIFQGFDAPETTGQQIITLIDQAKLNQGTTGEKIVWEQSFNFKIPFLGVVDLKDFSLFSLSAILGLVDGFNPCAMWVLMTFLLILWQIKDRKKMFQVAGLFILAQIVMYWLILNFWFRTWDFIGLDKIITPVIGLLAVGGGLFFLYRFVKNWGKLVCETDLKKQSKTELKIKKLVGSPFSILTMLGIIGVALSVNVVEFACSVGIPQAFTKILELNELSVWTEQFFLFIYTIFYILDDCLIFGLAVYGFSKFYAVGQKYSNWSSLIGGVLMLILGILLLFSPGSLVF